MGTQIKMSTLFLMRRWKINFMSLFLNPDKIIMIKSGAFFNNIGKDAIILKYVLRI